VDAKEINSIPIIECKNFATYKKACKYEQIVLEIVKAHPTRLHLEIRVMQDKDTNRPKTNPSNGRPWLHLRLIQKKPKDRVIYAGFGEDYGQWFMVYETLMTIGPELIEEKFDALRPS